MKKLLDIAADLSLPKKVNLGVSIIGFTLVLYCLTTYLCFRNHSYFHTAERINGWAILISVCSLGSLAAVHGFIRQWTPVGTASFGTLSFVPPWRIHFGGLLLGALGVAICLPATFRAIESPREVMIFWHDEGITLELVQAFVVGEKDVPDYRFTQGWVTFLPVALALKAVNALVPVHFALTNFALRSYQLTMIFCICYFTYRLVWQISRSWWLGAAVVLISYTRSEFFHISLAIDRPDTFQLVFVLLSLLYVHRFWIAGEPRQWFFAVFFASFAFASKYSGHLLIPVLLLVWIVRWRQPEVLAAYPTALKRWLIGTAIVVSSIGLIFPFTFFVLSPYHLIKLPEVLSFFRMHLVVYKTGNVYSLPNMEPPAHVLLWWGVFTSRYAFDFWLTVLGLAGAGAAVVKNVISRSKETRVRGEWLLLGWGGCYFSFLVYQYGLVDYRYIMPAQYVLPCFLLLPILWLQQSSVLSRVPYRTCLGVGVVASILLLCSARIGDTLHFLGQYRSEESVQQCYDVGRYLDRSVPEGDNPRILITNVAYVPPRFTRLEIRNVDITPERMEKSRFDYVIMTDNMYAIYADKPTVGHEQQYDPIYKVYYVDVVDTYTKFKNQQHPDYQYVRSFADFHIFERTERIRQRAQFSSVK